MMKSHAWLSLAAGLIATLAAFPGFARETKQTTASAEHLAQLKKFRLDCVQSLLDGKVERISAYYGESVRLMPEYQKTVLGKTNALFYHKAFAERFRVESYSREEKEVIDLGARIVEIGFSNMKLTLKSTGQAHELSGKYLDLWEKSANGDLSLIVEAWNYSHPVDFADALRFENVPAVLIALQSHLPVRGKVAFELAALNKLLEAVVTQHDDNVWSQFYADDGMFIYSHNPLYEGRKALDEFLEKHARELPVFEHLDIRNDRIDDLGNYVIEYASHIANWRNGESSGVGTGKDLRIWRREPDGSLKLYRTIGMYD